MGLKFETDSPLLLKLRCGAAASYRGASCCGSLWCDQAATAQNRYGALAPRQSKPHLRRKDGGLSTLQVSKYAWR